MTPQQRLEKARNWLSASDPRDISISEIAYGVGFKSPAHFSRMFKRVFKVNPREFRGECTEHADLQQHGPHEAFAHFGGNTLQ